MRSTRLHAASTQTALAALAAPQPARSAPRQAAPAGHAAPAARRAPLRRQTRQQRLSSLRAGAGQIQKVDAEQLQAEITGRTKPLVIDFYATWCGPCLLLAKELEKVAEQMGDKVKILKVDTDENPDLSNQLRIEGLPTLVFVGTDPAKPAIRTEGLLPAETIVTIINEELSKLAADAPAADAPQPAQ